MKFLFDFLPVALFFAAFKFAGIYVATGVAIATTAVQVLWLKLRGQRVHGMLWASLAIIVVFGGATLLLQDDTFIKWKPTVLYWLFSIVLAVSPVLFHKNLIRMMLSEQMKLPDGIWGRLNWSWVVFFAVMGILNLYVAFSFSESYCANIADGMARSECANNIWVNFKLFGGIGLMIAFVVGQTLLLAKYVEEDKA